MTLIQAAVRDDVAKFIEGVVIVYAIMIIAYIFSNLYFGFGGRLPYARWSSAVLSFVRDVSEPYLGFFRRLIPPLGPLDLSPMIGLILLYFVGGVVTSIIRG